MWQCNVVVLAMKRCVLVVFVILSASLLSCSEARLVSHSSNETAMLHGDSLSDGLDSLYFETVDEALANFIGDAVYEVSDGPQESLESLREKYGEETILRAIGFYDEIDELLGNRMEELSNVMDTYNKESQNLRKKRDAGSFGESDEYDRACDALAERYDSIYAMVKAKYKRLEKELEEKYSDVDGFCKKYGLFIPLFKDIYNGTW